MVEILMFDVLLNFLLYLIGIKMFLTIEFQRFRKWTTCVQREKKMMILSLLKVVINIFTQFFQSDNNLTLICKLTDLDDNLSGISEIDHKNAVKKSYGK